MRAKTPQLLPNQMTDEQKAFLAPKKPPKVFIPPNTVKHFAETRQKRAELRTDYDRSLGQSYRASKEAKKVAQLGQQDNQAIPHFVVQPYDDPETASMIEREARGQGADVQYQDYYPTAQVVNKYRYGHDLVKPGELARLGTQMRRLHEWYLKACRKGDRYLTVSLRDEHYFRGKEEINLELEELFQLFNQDTLDKAVISCYCLMKKLECKRGKLDPIGFIDPNTVHVVTVRDYPKDTEDNMLMFLQKQADKEDIFFPYNFKAWKRFINVVPGKWKPELTFEDYPIMASPSINFNQFLEKEKLKSNGSNFTDWFRHVRIFLNGGNLQYVLEAPLGPPPPPAVCEEEKNVFETRTKVRANLRRTSRRVARKLPLILRSLSVALNLILTAITAMGRGTGSGIAPSIWLIEERPCQEEERCEACLMGKMTKTPFSGIMERATDLLEIIHTDVCGPMSVASRGGYCYVLTFTDDLSRYGYIYFMKHKSETFQKFKEFQSEVENQRNKKIKFLRSDRGGEYLSYEFGMHLKKCGILSQLTPPGTPQRNGVSERRNRTLLDMVRSMMSLTDLPLSFWGYALETAAFTLNRAPSKSVATTPYELWFNKKPKLSFLKVWGCEAYVKKLQPDKLEPKAEKCVFIGYPKETIGYTFYHKSEGKIFVAKNGTFLEKEFLTKE
ncbi:hypothetical protein QYE76_054366, partial [Lolium multiflorum]